VVAATDFGRLPGGSFFLVMEYVNGRTLRTVLEQGALEAACALHVLHGIVSALHAAHSLGIVHRDMKPENIMLMGCGLSSLPVPRGRYGSNMGMAIGHMFLTFIGQAGAATQDVHVPMQAAMQEDACFGHCFSHP
jgi:serine/threonine protein kinase